MAKEKITTTRRVKTDQYERVVRDLPNGGRTISHVKTGKLVVGDIEVWIDFDQLVRRYGVRAIDSKGKKVTLAKGAIVLKAVNVKEEQPA